MSPTPSRPMAAQGTGEALLEGEVAKLHGLLSLQSCPIKDVTLKVGKKRTCRPQYGPAAYFDLHAALLTSPPLWCTWQAGPVPSSSKALLHVEVQSAAYDRDSRTLRIQVYPEVDPSAKSYMQLLLALPLQVRTPHPLPKLSPKTTPSNSRTCCFSMQLELFFPESLSDPPLLFGSTDGAALISERVSILPLDRSSLMHALSVIISTIKSEVSAGSSISSAAARQPAPPPQLGCLLCLCVAGGLHLAAPRRLATGLRLRDPHPPAIVPPLGRPSALAAVHVEGPPPHHPLPHPSLLLPGRRRHRPAGRALRHRPRAGHPLAARRHRGRGGAALPGAEEGRTCTSL